MIPEWLSVFLALGGSALISTAVAFMFNRVVKAFESRQNEIRVLEAKQREQERQQKALEFHTNLMQEITEELAPLKGQTESIKQGIETSTKVSITNIRALLKMLHDQYMAQGYADTGDKATWFELLDNYKALGGNHFKEYVDMWRENVENLPVPKKSTETK